MFTGVLNYMHCILISLTFLHSSQILPTSTFTQFHALSFSFTCKKNFKEKMRERHREGEGEGESIMTQKVDKNTIEVHFVLAIKCWEWGLPLTTMNTSSMIPVEKRFFRFKQIPAVNKYVVRGRNHVHFPISAMVLHLP